MANERRPCPEDNILVEKLLASRRPTPVHVQSVGMPSTPIGWAIFGAGPHWPRAGDVTW